MIERENLQILELSEMHLIPGPDFYILKDNPKYIAILSSAEVDDKFTGVGIILKKLWNKYMIDVYK